MRIGLPRRGNDMVQCRECGRKFRPENLTEHPQSHSLEQAEGLLAADPPQPPIADRCPRCGAVVGTGGRT